MQHDDVKTNPTRPTAAMHTDNRDLGRIFSNSVNFDRF